MAKDLVLVTGATGHLGFRTLVFTLQHGFKARVALRKLEQAEKLKATASLKPFADDLEFVHVPDITAAGAYDEVIKGVDYVLHIASPLFTWINENEARTAGAVDAVVAMLTASQRDWRKLLYDPAEKATLSMLTAAAKELKVKRVVVTSSVVVQIPSMKEHGIGPYDIKPVPSKEELDNAPYSGAAYVNSKVLAHHAATDFVEKNKVHFDLVRVLPGYIQGANELYQSAEEMRDGTKIGSNEGVITTALGSDKDNRLTFQVFLDDVAKAHVLALDKSKVKSMTNLPIVGNGGLATSWRDVAEIIKRDYPDAVSQGILKPGSSGTESKGLFDVRESEAILGFKFAGPEEYTKSVVDQYLGFVRQEKL